MTSCAPLSMIGPDGVELIIMIVATFGQAVSGGGFGLNIVYILIVWRVIVGVFSLFGDCRIAEYQSKSWVSVSEVTTP